MTKKEIQEMVIEMVENNISDATEWDNNKQVIDEVIDEAGLEMKRTEFYNTYLLDCDDYHQLIATGQPVSYSSRMMRNLTADDVFDTDGGWMIMDESFALEAMSALLMDYRPDLMKKFNDHNSTDES